MVENNRIEQVKYRADMAVTRAVAPLNQLQMWLKSAKLNNIPLLCLKGGDLHDEISEFKCNFSKKTVRLLNLNQKFDEEFFETKKILEVF